MRRPWRRELDGRRRGKNETIRARTARRHVDVDSSSPRIDF